MEKSGGRIVLSKRLQMLAEMVTPGRRLADVGCDHGFLSIYLVQAGVCPRALAMDVREGPLAGARQHVADCGLADYISVRLSDGLAACGVGEADTLVCAGMGGRLMERILRDGMDRAQEMRELILQPQSEISQFRTFLREAGFQVVGEDAVCEEGKFYFGMKAVPVRAGEALFKEAGRCRYPEDKAAIERQKLYDLFGEALLNGRHPVLFSYLAQRKGYLLRLAASLGESDSLKAEGRLGEVQEELSQIEGALSFYRQETLPMNG